MTRTELVPVAFIDAGLGNSSYLLDLGDGGAVVVDPARDATPYLAAAERAGLSIAYTVETHLHADFLTGSRELAARGATVLASRAAGIEWPHRGDGDGDELDIGGLRLSAVATPGHISWLLADGTRPVCLFSGGDAFRRLGGPHRPHRAGANRAAGPIVVAIAACADPHPP